MSEYNVQLRGELNCPICETEYEEFNRETVIGDYSYNYCEELLNSHPSIHHPQQ